MLTRAAGEDMDKLAHFMDFKFETDSLTLFPRFETEILVEKAVGLLSKRLRNNAPCRILDIGTGCGNIAISLTNYIPSSRIIALDISESALSVARKNAARLGVLERIDFMRSDLFQGISSGYSNFFDLVISNPPYVSMGDLSSLPAEVRDDPYVALYGGRDGLALIRKIIDKAHLFMNEEGFLLIEIGYDQGKIVKELLNRSDFYQGVELFEDYAHIERIAKAKKGKANG